MTTVMEHPEDLSQLILGIPSPSFFEELYAEGMNVHKDKLSDWFDAKTGQLGGHDAVETVTELIGNASRFTLRVQSQEFLVLIFPISKISLGERPRSMVEES